MSDQEFDADKVRQAVASRFASVGGLARAAADAATRLEQATVAAEERARAAAEAGAAMLAAEMEKKNEQTIAEVRALHTEMQDARAETQRIRGEIDDIVNAIVDGASTDSEPQPVRALPPPPAPPIFSDVPTYGSPSYPGPPAVTAALLRGGVAHGVATAEGAFAALNELADGIDKIADYLADMIDEEHADPLRRIAADARENAETERKSVYDQVISQLIVDIGSSRDEVRRVDDQVNAALEKDGGDAVA